MKKKYSVDSDYFKVIDNEEKAYWLGFLYADGCILTSFREGRSRGKVLEITLCEEDSFHLVKLKNSLHASQPVSEKQVKLNDKVFNSYKLAICDTKICNNLINLGCISRKTYVLKYPNKDIVPDRYMRDFIRGYFDGDGCIHIKNQTTFEISITGIHDFLVSIISYLVENEIITVIPKLYNSHNSHAWSFFLYGQSAIDFLEYIYRNSYMYLERKFKAYLNCCENDTIRKGVYWHKRNKAWIVTITINKKHIRYGQYKDLYEANYIRKKLEIYKMKLENNLPIQSEMIEL